MPALTKSLSNRPLESVWLLGGSKFRIRRPEWSRKSKTNQDRNAVTGISPFTLELSLNPPASRRAHNAQTSGSEPSVARASVTRCIPE